jgi:hypothetical protein
MKKIVYAIFCFSVLFLSSCETEMVDQIDPFNLRQGGYMRTVTPFPMPIFQVSKARMDSTQLDMVLEAVTPNFGANFDNYALVIRFVDNSLTNGNNSKPDAPLRTLRASDFTKDPTTGYPRFRLIVTGRQMLTASGLTVDQTTDLDQFQIRAKMTLTDGSVFDASNSSADVLGGAFYSSPFLYRANVVN